MQDNLVDTALKQAAACAREKYAGEEKRISKALLLALNGKVSPAWPGTDYRSVQSDSDPEVFYRVHGRTCDCPDNRNAPDGRCKHVIAAYLVTIAQAALAMRNTDR